MGLPDSFLSRQPGGLSFWIEELLLNQLGSTRAHIPYLDQLRLPRTEKHGLKRGGACADLERAWELIQVAHADPAGGRDPFGHPGSIEAWSGHPARAGGGLDFGLRAAAREIGCSAVEK